MFYPNITTWGWRVAAISKNVTDIHFFIIQGGSQLNVGRGRAGKSKDVTDIHFFVDHRESQLTF